MWLLSHSVSVLLIFLAVAAVCRWPRLGPAARHAFWLVVLFKLLTPPFIAWPWSLPVLPLSWSQAVRQAALPPTPDARHEDGPRERMASPPATIPAVERNDKAMSPVDGSEILSDQAQPILHFEWKDRAINVAAAVWLG